MLELALNRDPDRVPALLAALPEPVRAEIAALDPVLLPLDRLSARLLLIHGRDDPVIPASESRALAAAVPPGNADVYVVGNLGHVDIGPGGIADTLLLWQASYRLLAQRDGLSVPDPARCALATTSAPG
jgi:pimeloyl-ACP methyl ester carboxylesterase